MQCPRIHWATRYYNKRRVEIIGNNRVAFSVGCVVITATTTIAASTEISIFGGMTKGNENCGRGFVYYHQQHWLFRFRILFTYTRTTLFIILEMAIWGRQSQMHQCVCKVKSLLTGGPKATPLPVGVLNHTLGGTWRNQKQKITSHHSDS